MAQPNHKRIIAQSAMSIYNGFQRYNEDFNRITIRARRRFEQRDWQGHQQDLVDRVDLYEKSVRRIVMGLRKSLGPRVTDHTLWKDIRWYYGQRIQNIPDAGFMKTYFNSVTRRIFDTLGTDPEVEFVSPAPDEGSVSSASLRLKRYPCWESMDRLFMDVLKDFSFKVAYQDFEYDARQIAKKVNQYARMFLDDYGDLVRIDFIDTVFYQSARAYLIGRILQPGHVAPIVIALKNSERDKGIQVDAVLLSEEEVSIVFSYTRSYYFADPNSVVGTVHFIHSILPRKPIDELYTVLGRLRQGKTERYRTFTRHLENTNDKFVHTEGDKGLVMIVFTLPSYDLVFKIMRDQFGYPKTISHADVVEKYKLVSKHDRAGRMIDTQEFQKLEFPIHRFSDELREELLTEAANRVSVEGGNLLFSQIYIERRVRPLNLYIEKVSSDEAALAILDYGQAIKDLAQTNIFPGDLLLKNFGVTRHNRVVFYDYDEVSLITDCNFRDIPEAKNDIDEIRSDTWFYVGNNDIFPQEFIKFLSMNAELQSIFLKVHGDLLTADYWRNIKAKHLAGEVSVVVPYYRPTLPTRKVKTLKTA